MPPASQVIKTYGQNWAAIKPLIDLSKRSESRKLPTSSLNDAFKEKFAYYSKHQDEVWREIYSVAQLIDLFIQGKQLLRRHPSTGAWMITPIRNEAMEKRAINQMRFWENALVAKWQQSNPNVTIKAGADSDKAHLAAKAANAISDYYEYRFYTSDFNERECKLGIRNGTYIERFRYDSSAQGIIGLRSIIENKDVQFGKGFGYCANCDLHDSADKFKPDMDSPVPSFKCPKCGENSTKVTPPAMLQAPSVVGQEQVQSGEIVCEQLPLQACRWNLMGRPEESSWFIYQQKAPLSAIQNLIGNVELKGETSDSGLDILDKLAYVGMALSGHAVGGDRNPEIFRQPVKVEEMSLGPEDIVDIRLSREEETVCGKPIPAGKSLAEIFPNGVVVCGLNGMSVITGIYAETHRDHLVSGYWHGNPNSGAGQGIGDSIEVQKRANTIDTQVVAALQAGSTPGFLYIKGVMEENEARYMGDPKVAIPIDWSLLPNEAKDLRKLVAPAFTPTTLPGQTIGYLQDFLRNQFQSTFGVTDFSGGLPGMAGRNDTATGAQIEAATSQAISTPVLQGKAMARKRGTEITIRLFKDCMPMARYFPMKGKFGREEFKQFSGSDVDAELRFETVPNSEATKTIYDVRKDLNDFHAQFGGIMGFLQAKQMFPREVSELAKKWDVDIENEDYDAITGICTRRIGQLKEGLKRTQNPQELLSFIQPPISEVEPQLDIKTKWLQEWLDTDEGQEAPMPLRQTIELVIHGQFIGKVQQEAAIAGGEGTVEAARQAPSAIGQQMLEQQSQPNEQPQVSPDAALKVQADQDNAARQSAESAEGRQHELDRIRLTQRHETEKQKSEHAQALALKQLELVSQEKQNRMQRSAA